ncbi:hypothetical protein KY362_06370 [Candidatus Woesearchaeota archaeon]|nr:hypothetical protein [Candidatus Woesearchaeota archaeon]
MATLSEWFKAGRLAGIDLERFLHIDQPKDLERLRASGLPCYEVMILPGAEFRARYDEICRFMDRHAQAWVRVLHRTVKGERYSDMGLPSADAVISFVEGRNVDLQAYDVQIYEFIENAYGGNVITHGIDTSIELTYGTQDNVGKSLVDFYHGRLNHLGRLYFEEDDPSHPLHPTPEDIRYAARDVLRFLKLGRGEYLQGYFEFFVGPKGEVRFLDYKTSLGRPESFEAIVERNMEEII